jgi:hypothetical protein
VAEDVHKIGDVAQKLMATIDDDPLLEDARVLDAAIVVAIRLPDDHPKVLENDTPTDFYRTAGSSPSSYGKLGLFRMGQLVIEDGDAVDDPEPP